MECTPPLRERRKTQRMMLASSTPWSSSTRMAIKAAAPVPIWESKTRTVACRAVSRTFRDLGRLSEYSSLVRRQHSSNEGSETLAARQ
jgi:hypothetical protein